MYTYILGIIMILLFLLIIFCAVLLLSIRKQKKELHEISEILRDLNAGNLNRKILLDSASSLSEIGFGINLLAKRSQDKLIALQKAEEAEKALMTGLSHDLRTPLTTLIGYLEAVDFRKADSRERETYIKTALQKAYDLKSCIDTLFEWFRLSSNEELFEFSIYDMVELTRDILADWIVIFEEKHILYEIDIPEQDIRLAVDKGAYARILNNLIQNTLTHSRATEIQVSLKKEDDRVQISVSDNGIGIPPAEISHIFERLYKCGKSRTGKGSGIGLAIVQKLVEKMGGSITVTSEPNVRTVFLITFQV